MADRVMADRLMADRTLFQTMVRVSSLLDFNKKPGKDTNDYEDCTVSEREHVWIYDAIATIMIRESKSEVLATSVVKTRNSVTIVWAKNDGEDPSTSTRAYYRALIDLFRSNADLGKIVKTVAEACKEKIVSRVKKFLASVQRLEGSGTKRTADFFRVDDKNPIHQRIHRSMIDKNFCKAETTMQKGLDKFVNTLMQINSQTDLRRILWVLRFSRILVYMEPSVGPRIPGPRFLAKEHGECLSHSSFSRLSKLADYEYSCILIQGRLKKDLTPLQRINIQLEQLRPAAVNKVTVKESLVGSLNHWKSLRGDQEKIEHIDDVRAWYPNADLSRAHAHGDIVLTPAQHAELTLAIILTRRQLNAGFGRSIEIGVSKAACDWCYLWVNAYNDFLKNSTDAMIRGTRIIIRATHGKRVSNWAMPTKHQPVKLQICQQLAQEMNEVCEQVKVRRRRSDTPGLSYDESAMDTMDELSSGNFEYEPL